MNDSAAAHVDDGFGVADVKTAPVVGVTAVSASTADAATSATTRWVLTRGRVTLSYRPKSVRLERLAVLQVSQPRCLAWLPWSPQLSSARMLKADA